MKAEENIEQQYDEVIKYLDGYRLFQRGISTQLLHLPVRHPIKYLRLVKGLPTALRQMNLLSGRNPDFNKRIGIEIITEGDKGSEYYPILVSDYPLHELSVSLENKFFEVDFDKLRKLHELRKSDISGLKIKQTVGVVLAVATLLLTAIPESVVGRVIDYKKFELIIFLTACLAIVYSFLILLPFWAKYDQARSVHGYATRVLEYTCIRKSQMKTEQAG